MRVRWPKWVDVGAAAEAAKRRLSRVSPERWGWPVEYVLEYASEAARRRAWEFSLGDYMVMWEVLGELNATGQFATPREAAEFVDVLFGLVEVTEEEQGRFDA